ncbi:LuxR C-terminal-related transcriptional regulator [Serratia sp. D1N4]
MNTMNTELNSSVYIIDEHPIVRDSLAMLISTRLGMRVSGGSENNSDLFVEIAKEKPGLIITDMNMSTMKVIANIRREYVKTKILVYSGRSEGVYSRRVSQMGANGFISRKYSFEILLNAINLVFNDINCFPNYNHDNEEVHPGVFGQLSKREVSIAIALTKGLKNHEISKFFNISEKTVSSHKRNILGKLKINNVIDLVGLLEVNNFID